MSDRRSLRVEKDLFIHAERMPDGGFQIYGHDLRGNPLLSDDPNQDYEYTITVRKGDLGKVVDALGGRPSDDALDLLQANYASISKIGELKWLKSLGISPDFWSWP